MYCVFCWMRGDVLDGRRLRVDAVLVMGGVSVCELAVHQEAALQGSVQGGLEFIHRWAAATSPPPSSGEQDHTGWGNRVKGPNDTPEDEIAEDMKSPPSEQ
jgi:hypothetical protein